MPTPFFPAKPTPEQLAFIKEEYSKLLGAIIDNENRILSLYSGTLTISVTLLGAICGYLFRADHKALITTGQAYITLAPIFLLIPSLLLVIGLRKDSARMAAFILVFVEERGLGPNWGPAVLAFRDHSESESLDAIPLSYLSIVLGCGAAFGYRLHDATGLWREDFPVGLLLIALLIPLSKRWKSAPYYLNICAEVWRAVRDKEDLSR